MCQRRRTEIIDPGSYRLSAGRMMSTAVEKARNKTGVGCLSFVLLVPLVIVIVVLVGAVSGRGPSVAIVHKIDSVKVLNSNEVRINIAWTNTGTGTASGSCIINTSVYNRFGDLTTVEVTATGTNGPLKFEQTLHLSQDQGVTAGDARFVKLSDITINNCRS